MTAPVTSSGRRTPWFLATGVLRSGWRAHRSAGTAVVVLTLLGAVGPIGVAWPAKFLFDELGRGRSARPGTALGLAVLAAAVGALNALVARVTGYAGQVWQHAVSLGVDERLYTRVNQFTGLRYFEDPVFHDRLRLAEEGAQQAPRIVVMFAMTLVRSTIGICLFVGALVVSWPPMALVLFAAAVPEVLVQVRSSRRMGRAHEAAIRPQRLRLLFRQLLTDHRAAGEIRLFGLGQLFHTRMLRAMQAATTVELQAQRRDTVAQAGLGVLTAVVAGIGTVVVVLGVLAGRVTLGDVTLFIAAVATVQGGLSALAAQSAQTMEALRRYGRYLEVLEAPDDVTTRTLGRAGPLRSGIVVRDVWFRYGDDEPWILRGLNLTIHHGRATGLVGVNGAGKSTLVKLLCRFYDPQRGQILWDGVDLRDLDPAWLRSRIGVTFQQYMAYDLTAAENIGIGQMSDLGDRGAIRSAAVAAEIDEKIASWPRGYDTLLTRAFLDDSDAAGAELSGGQWQRIALARCLMRADADLLILDEPSSGLDAEAEHRIHQTLRRHRAGRTSLLISHRLSALRDADQIAVISDGSVVETGPHDDLMTRGGRYARLFTIQAHGYQDQRVAAREA